MCECEFTDTAVNLERILQEYSNRKTPDGTDYQIRLDQQPKENAKAFVVAAKDSEDSRAGYQQFLFRSYPTPEGLPSTSGTNDCEVWQAGRATSAAPTYFEPFELNGENYYDGGVIANNPVRVALREAESLWPGREIGCVLSLGCGWFGKERGDGLRDTLIKGKDQLTATQPSHVEMLEDFCIDTQSHQPQEAMVEWMYADAGTAMTRSLAIKNPLRWEKGTASAVALSMGDDFKKKPRPINLRHQGEKDFQQFENQDAAQRWLGKLRYCQMSLSGLSSQPSCFP